ncbi:FkbM family methyltransferase [Noviherbaspirillum sp.]|uniref:FkbM family methyltransferase n=1 Tax=Noviherbaspirillum sp. TaxID=1926288 RepID=UPI002FE23DCE
MSLRKMLGKSVTEMATKRGYEIIPFWKMAERPLVDHLRRLFAQYGIDTVIDVGANKGQFHDLVRNDVGFRGQIHSFEPVSSYAQGLKQKSIDDTAWKIHPYALGSAPGTAEINVTQSPGLNSFLAPRTDVVAGFWNDNSISHVEKVAIRTLDDVLADEGIDCSRQGVYLKLDTQGFDLEVIKGARKSIAGIRGLQSEASIRPIYHGMPTYNETIQEMNELGFALSGMFPVTSDVSLRLVELDFVFINNHFTSSGPHR